MSRPFQLFRLQQLDSQMDTIQNRLHEIEIALSSDEAVRQASQAAEKAESALKQARKNLHQAEDNVHQQRLKIEQDESTLYGGRMHNPKELKDLENEVAALKRYRSVLEDRQLETMLAEEEAAAEAGSAQAALEQASAAFAQRSAELLQEQARLQRDLGRLVEERNAATGDIPADDLGLYSQLRQKRKGVAVAKVTDKACSACGSTLNSSLLNAAYSPNQLNLCSACGRILYTG
jgi:uncharacterized protein